MEAHPLTPHEELNNPVDTTETSYKLTRLPSIRPADELPAEEFLYLVQLVREAISQKILPECIAQGSSGSYFCTDPKRKKVGVFKPKNEEPYGHLNPKWMKWLHRNLLPCCFGRSCLIPNLGYISEAGASLIDRRLQMGLVPRTEVIRLSSSSFHYSKKDIEAANRPSKQVPLPLKIGSFQLFLHKYQNASTFLEQNPWPLECALDGIGISKPRSPTIVLHNDEETRLLIDGGANDIWTPELQMEFRLQLEKLVIFDYLIRNTDRGLDNWMIQYNPNNVDIEPEVNPFDSSILPKSTKEINIAAIDHGLAFPHKHPDNWRSYPYGWLSLPQSLINRPFSPSIRAYFLPLLSSARWWQQTIYDMRKLFEIDEDFNEDMFQAQMAVLKGQGWNIVESLKQPEEGPIELCNRTPAIVWDEVLDPASSPTIPSPPPDSADQTKLVEQGADPSNFDWPDPFSEQWVAFNKVTPNRRVRKRLKKLSKKAWFRSC